MRLDTMPGRMTQSILVRRLIVQLEAAKRTGRIVSLDDLLPADATDAHYVPYVSLLINALILYHAKVRASSDMQWLIPYHDKLCGLLNKVHGELRGITEAVSAYAANELDLKGLFIDRRVMPYLSVHAVEGQLEPIIKALRAVRADDEARVNLAINSVKRYQVRVAKDAAAVLKARRMPRAKSLLSPLKGKDRLSLEKLANSPASAASAPTTRRGVSLAGYSQLIVIEPAERWVCLPWPTGWITSGVIKSLINRVLAGAELSRGRLRLARYLVVHPEIDPDESLQSADLTDLLSMRADAGWEQLLCEAYDSGALPDGAIVPAPTHFDAAEAMLRARANQHIAWFPCTCSARKLAQTYLVYLINLFIILAELFLLSGVFGWWPDGWLDDTSYAFAEAMGGSGVAYLSWGGFALLAIISQLVRQLAKTKVESYRNNLWHMHAVSQQFPSHPISRRLQKVACRQFGAVFVVGCITAMFYAINQSYAKDTNSCYYQPNFYEFSCSWPGVLYELGMALLYFASGWLPTAYIFDAWYNVPSAYWQYKDADHGALASLLPRSWWSGDVPRGFDQVGDVELVPIAEMRV